MIANNKEKNINYFRIVTVLRSLLSNGNITKQEYGRAKNYYRKLTGADIYVAD